MIPILRALWPYLRQRRALLAVAVVAMLMEVITAAAMPWPLKFVFDQVLFKKGSSGKPKLRGSLSPHIEQLLVIIVLVALLIALLDALFTWVDTYLSEVAAQRAVFDLRRDVFQHLQGLSVSFHQHTDTRVGDLGARLSGDIGALQDIAAGGISNVITNGLTIVVMTILMFLLDPVMSGVAVIGIVPMALITRRNTRRMRIALREARKQEGQVASVVQESLSSIRLVQAYGREQVEVDRLAAANERSLAANLNAAGLLARVGPSMTVLSSGTTAALTIIGVHRVIGRAITPGELLIFVSYLRGMQAPIRQLARLGYSISKATAGLDRIQEVLAHEPEVADRPGAVTVSSCRGDVRFAAVTFGYAPDRRVLHGIDLTVPAGSTVAIVGATGSGKSTLLSLLPRFHDVVSGAVTLDGHDVRDLTVRSLREQIGLVLQDTVIFRMSILDNIAYGKPGASRDEVIAAAEAAGVDRIAARLDGGYDAIVAERGTTLSGGEKQCVGIARALLKGSPVIILDEPTSAMDAFTERIVLDGLDRLLERRTVLMIAHRLGTVMKADTVAVLRDGRLIETGNPAKLIDDETSAFHQMAAVQRYFGPPAAGRAYEGGVRASP